VVQSRQEMFDRAIGKLLQQGQPAKDEEGSCVYRANDGSRCAIGWLLSKKALDFMEEHDLIAGYDFLALKELHEEDLPIKGFRFKKGDTEFLQDLQAVHDSFAEDLPEPFPDYLRRRARLFAEEYQLSTEVLG
jgi:hypothetical protein